MTACLQFGGSEATCRAQLETCQANARATFEACLLRACVRTPTCSCESAPCVSIAAPPVLRACPSASLTITGTVTNCSPVVQISRCRIRNHFAWGFDSNVRGGGVVALEGLVEDSWFESNQAIGNLGATGGGLALGTGSVRRCVFINNRAEVGRMGAFAPAHGGAVGVWGACTIHGCIFAENVAIGSSVAGLGGAIGSSATDPLEVWRCTIIGNKAWTNHSPSPPPQPIGGVFARNGTVASCIVVWNEGLAVNNDVVTRCTNFFGNTLGDSLRGQEEGGNFSADPLFCSPDPIGTRTFSLRADSPCVPGTHPNAGCGLVGASLVGLPCS